MDEADVIYERLIIKYKKTGYLGHSQPYNLDAAKRQAWMITQNILRRASAPIKMAKAQHNLEKTIQAIQLKLAI